jgi:acyl carrier protein
MATILQVPASDVTRETVREDLDAWDSVQHLNLMLAVEDEFGVSLDVDALQSLTSVPRLLEYLSR